MAREELTQSEKARLLVLKDYLNPDSYDREFYDKLWATDLPDVFLVDEGIRQALTKFLPEYLDYIRGILDSEDLPPPVFSSTMMMMCFVTGYEVGRTLQRPLTPEPVTKQ